jgi:hypothetical protein
VKRDAGFSQTPVDIELFCLTGGPKSRGKTDAEWVASEKERAIHMEKDTQETLRHCSGVQDKFR